MISYFVVYFDKIGVQRRALEIEAPTDEAALAELRHDITMCFPDGTAPEVIDAQYRNYSVEGPVDPPAKDDTAHVPTIAAHQLPPALGHLPKLANLAEAMKQLLISVEITEDSDRAAVAALQFEVQRLREATRCAIDSLGESDSVKRALVRLEATLRACDVAIRGGGGLDVAQEQRLAHKLDDARERIGNLIINTLAAMEGAQTGPRSCGNFWSADENGRVSQ